MILRVIDEDENITIMNVMVLEYKTGDTIINIWDYGDNPATIQTKQFMDAIICVENLYKNKEATIYADIDFWEEEE